MPDPNYCVESTIPKGWSLFGKMAHDATLEQLEKEDVERFCPTPVLGSGLYIVAGHGSRFQPFEQFTEKERGIYHDLVGGIIDIRRIGICPTCGRSG